MAHDDERDVLIIGAGAAGGAMAWSLARRKVDVVWGVADARQAGDMMW